jgi:hypothetical protein
MSAATERYPSVTMTDVGSYRDPREILSPRIMRVGFSLNVLA